MEQDGEKGFSSTNLQSIPIDARTMQAVHCPSGSHTPATRMALVEIPGEEAQET